MDKFNIAIDGPAGAGKSTIARLVANALSFVYVDTGAMYRAVTWSILQQGLPLEQTADMIALTERLDIRLVSGDHGQLVYVDGQDVTGMIRSAEVTGNVSRIASIAEIRSILTAKQKELAKMKGVVMDGRDIGSHVLPEAELKIFLTASVRVRAERRLKEVSGDRPDITLDRLEQEIAERDRMDEQREASPLVKALDAVWLDTTEMTIPEVVDRILELCKTRVSGVN
ncbi:MULTISPECIES: (d)CMP kinase [unclassified Paenibacillus]|uniref:(d)CMP kinase n=1 Tax=unclassified Paenibacillus TaxID=185978 RepID=UPI001AE40895|nr:MULTISPECIES: (d)CMP kinase [unclassified Paenibacillus]MBP1155239.1 cytidylate kinase [Paenibacillus sp. PvP091]MBP1169377.1 cytidylate kinase [Paenibacillus sp. PvR098]MBP2440405.1 cytidylate kinase [Paenibacillus sp. PvP052]